MTPEQLEAQRKAFIVERNYLKAWDEAIEENYRRIKADHEERRFLNEFNREAWDE